MFSLTAEVVPTSAVVSGMVRLAESPVVLDTQRVRGVALGANSRKHKVRRIVSKRDFQSALARIVFKRAGLRQTTGCLDVDGGVRRPTGCRHRFAMFAPWGMGLAGSDLGRGNPSGDFGALHPVVRVPGEARTDCGAVFGRLGATANGRAVVAIRRVFRARCWSLGHDLILPRASLQTDNGGPCSP